MFGDQLKKHFLDLAGSWTCDDYALDIRYVASRTEAGLVVRHASIKLNPLRHDRDLGLRVVALGIEAGQVQKYPTSKQELMQVLSDAANGIIKCDDLELRLPAQDNCDQYSEMSHGDNWFFPLHLRVSSKPQTVDSPDSKFVVDAELRTLTPPFDGIEDLVNWLELSPDFSGGRASTIDINVFPPVDLITDKCALSEGVLSCEIHAHPQFNVETLSLAIRCAPSPDLNTRAQIAEAITWSPPEGDRRVGTLRTELPDSDSVLTLLSIGHSTVRRQWFNDPARARNHLHLCVNQFDGDYRKLRNSLFESTDAREFERGVALLMFILGFSSALPIGTESPDVILSTPIGRIAVVECTLKIADLATKVGKLVDRRSSLVKSLTAAHLPSQVAAVLVSRQPRDQIAIPADELTLKNVVLLTSEDIERALLFTRHMPNSDAIWASAFAFQ
ncbi:MAG: hypothetical protein CFE43_05010 [Burkholderiales bacterium PBB3]|nr:MAG: hypothetical protein CFE43_05010 [Burkholderiales bacterium PBB3]